MTEQMPAQRTGSPRTTAAPGAEAMRAGLPDVVHLPGNPAYDAARVAWNVQIDQRPAAVAVPRSPAEVSEVLRVAASAGLRVAVQGTGHNPGPLGDLATTVLLRTSALTGVTIDPVARRARVHAAALWSDVVEPAAEHGLACLHGSSPDVGVFGYTLGGGLSWYGRWLGLQSNHVTAAEVVLADGAHVRADADHEADLFWALRGGGGNFGVVTALEFDLHPLTSAYAGMLVFDWHESERVLHRWADWAVDAPDAVTTSFRILQVPELPEIPEPFRGRQLAAIDGAIVADDDVASAILAPLRRLGPQMDTFARVPTSALTHLHMDPEEPTPALSGSAMLTGMPTAAIDAFVAMAGPGSGSPLVFAELRQLGGALSRPDPDGGALSSLDGQFVLFGVGITPTPEAATATVAHTHRLVETMRPWSTGRRYLNFTEEHVDTSTGFDDQTWARLRRIRAAVDPTGVIVANHPVPAAEPSPV